MTRLVAEPRHRARIHCLVAVLAWAACAAVASASVEPTVPRPQGWVSDYVGVIDAATRKRIEAQVAELRAKTGAEISIVVVATTEPLTAFDYAIKIAEDWKPGGAERDNGVLFLVATEDRALFILTGYGVEGALPDGRVGAIRDQIVVPAFRRGDFGGGIAAATAEMVRIIAADAGVELTGVAPTPPPSPRRTRPSPLVLIAVLGLIGLLLFVVVRYPVVAAALMQGQRRGRHRYGGWRHGGWGGGGFGHGGFGGLGGGGGFGGFGGGGFGGGGAGGRW